MQNVEIDWSFAKALHSVIGRCMVALDIFESNNATMPQMMVQFMKIINESLVQCEEDNDWEKAEWENRLNEIIVDILFEYTFGAKWSDDDR